MSASRVAAPAPEVPPAVGWWHRNVHPRLLDRIMDSEESRPIRARLCAELAGDVLEIGFGTGHNLAHLPAAVRRVLAVEPLARSLELAEPRIAEAGVDVDVVAPDARTLPLADASVDDVLCTWNLCSIDGAQLAVAEAARVLRPGGRFHFVEHGRATDERVRRWQHRLDPLWSRFSCGCHIDRDIPAIIEAGGLEIVEMRTYAMESEPSVLGWTFEGRARLATG